MILLVFGVRGWGGIYIFQALPLHIYPPSPKGQESPQTKCEGQRKIIASMLVPCFAWRRKLTQKQKLSRMDEGMFAHLVYVVVYYRWRR